MTLEGDVGIIDQMLAEIEEEVNQREKTIKLRTAMGYLMELIDEPFKPTFQRASTTARGSEEMMRVIDLMKRQIGQQAAMDILGSKI
jgi:transcriptional regulator GlxA family with amidase domain